MTVTVDGERIKVLFQYVQRPLGKKRFQRGVEVLILRPARYEGDQAQVLGQSLRFCDSRDRFDKVRGRREGLIAALQDACENHGWGRQQRLQVWDAYQSQCRVVEGDRFEESTIYVNDIEITGIHPAPRVGFIEAIRITGIHPAPRVGFIEAIRQRIAASKSDRQQAGVGS